MRIENSYRIIPCYTADVSGVCSALFELGGMVVMHDPSGCNSTYNTHDETRWYDHDSLIYITALTEQDAIMGNDKKAVRDIIDAAQRLKPRFIALCGSPIPYLNGTDYKALARIIERKTGIISFAVETNGMHDYIQGAGAALLEYAKHVLKPQWDASLHHGSHIRVNILGATPLDFAAYDTIDSLKSVLGCRGFDIVSVFSMLGEAEIDSLTEAVTADVNLVISAVGYKLAQYMLTEYGMPFVVGMPVGAFTDKLCADIEQAAKLNAHHTSSEQAIWSYGAAASDDAATSDGAATSCGSATSDGAAALSDTAAVNSISAISDTAAVPKALSLAYACRLLGHELSVPCTKTEASDQAPELAIIGEPVSSGSIAAAITAKYGLAVSVLCPLEACELFLTADDHCFKGEKQCTKLMKQYKHVIADPLYLPICPEGVSFHRLPHAAFSGRCCKAEIKNLVTLLD